MVGKRFQIKYPVAWPVSLAVEAAGFRDTFREAHPGQLTDPGLYTHASVAGQAILDRTPPSFGYGPQPWPLAAGNYSVYLLRDDGYHVLARNVFRVIR